MTVSELLNQIYEKAKSLNIDLEMDGEDVQVFALQKLLDNFEEIFEDDTTLESEEEIRDDDESQCVDCLNDFDDCNCE